MSAVMSAVMSGGSNTVPFFHKTLRSSPLYQDGRGMMMGGWVCRSYTVSDRAGAGVAGSCARAAHGRVLGWLDPAYGRRRRV